MQVTCRILSKTTISNLLYGGNKTECWEIVVDTKDGNDRVLSWGITNHYSLEEFHQHVVLAYVENFFVISSYLWPPESKSEWCKCVHVERSEIWVKNAIFWSKNMFLACCEAFTNFSLSIHIDNNFLIIIAGDSTTYLLLSVCFKSKMWIFSIFG